MTQYESGMGMARGKVSVINGYLSWSLDSPCYKLTINLYDYNQIATLPGLVVYDDADHQWNMASHSALVSFRSLKVRSANPIVYSLPFHRTNVCNHTPAQATG